MQWNDRLLVVARDKAKAREREVLEAIAHKVRDTAPWIALERVGSRLTLRARQLGSALADRPALRAILGGWA